jgi:hypothetical protein
MGNGSTFREGQSMIIYESEIEQITLEIQRDENGYIVLYGPDLVEGVNPVVRAYCNTFLLLRN